MDVNVSVVRAGNKRYTIIVTINESLSQKLNSAADGPAWPMHISSAPFSNNNNNLYLGWKGKN